MSWAIQRVGSAGQRRRLVSSWDPSMLTLKAWYRADDALLTGSAIDQLNDKSGGGEHVVQATAGAKPTQVTRYGQLAASFDGGDRLNKAFAASQAQPTTTYVVWELPSTSGVQVLVDNTGSNPHAIYVSSGTILCGSGSNLTGPAVSTGTLYASCFIANGASSEFYGASDFVTASVTGNAGTNALVGRNIGTNRTGAGPVTGYIPEVIDAVGAHDLATRKLVGDYLTARYTGLTVVTS